MIPTVVLAALALTGFLVWFSFGRSTRSAKKALRAPTGSIGRTIHAGETVPTGGTVMMRRNLPLFALVLAAGVVGAFAAGIPVETLLLLLLVLACPLMMLFMHGGHGGHGTHSDRGETGQDSDKPNHSAHQNSANNRGIPGGL